MNVIGDLGEIAHIAPLRAEKKGNALHEYEFKDKNDLRRFFTPHFKHVNVWETIYPTGRDLYFAASHHSKTAQGLDEKPGSSDLPDWRTQFCADSQIRHGQAIAF